MRTSPVLFRFLIASMILVTGCAMNAAQSDSSRIGNAQLGQKLISTYGCGSCHTISGVTGAHGMVGPPLTNVGSRVVIGGMLVNTPENLVRWVQHPHEFNPRTVMPELGVGPQDAANIAAYLYSLR